MGKLLRKLLIIKGTCEEDGTSIDLEIDDIESISITTKHCEYAVKFEEVHTIRVDTEYDFHCSDHEEDGKEKCKSECFNCSIGAK